jgi:membrane associated rhomboid family serine protease
MSETARNSDNYCYRHPDRESYIICQRCGRTICPECQTQAAVGVHCPECVKLDRQETPRQARRISNPFRNSGSRPVVTYTLIGLNVFLYLLQMITGGSRSPVYLLGAFYGPLTQSEPWRIVTSLFLHSPQSIFHIIFNMYALFIFGPMIEQLVGRVRYIVLYLLAGIGGSVAVLLIAPQSVVVGASGAIFGLLAAYFVIARRLGANSGQILVVIVLNLAIGFIPGSGVAWQAHVGGLVVGGAIAFLYTATRRRQQRTLQIGALVGIGVLLIVLTVVGVSLTGSF